jgi:hypothetical protein
MAFVLKSSWKNNDGVVQTSQGTHGYKTLEQAKEARLYCLKEEKTKKDLTNFNISIIEMDVPLLDVK